MGINTGYCNVGNFGSVDRMDYTIHGAEANLAARLADVRFASKGDMCGAQAHVRFTPNSDRKSGLPQRGMSALPPKADMCSAMVHVCFGPEADINAKLLSACAL